jgi:hypothetical protein
MTVFFFGLESNGHESADKATTNKPVTELTNERSSEIVGKSTLLKVKSKIHLSKEI